MVKGIICFVVGSWVGVMLMALLQAGRDTEWVGELSESIQVDGFVPVRGFSPNCAHVCGNCDNWNSEIFAWGECRICKLSGQMREAGKRCNIRNGEVVRK